MFQGTVHTQLEREKRHVHDDQGSFDGSPHHFGVVDHLVERHSQRRFAALDNHPQAVSHQDPVDARAVEEGGQGEIVGREHGDLLARSLLGHEIRHRNAATLAVHGLHCDTPLAPWQRPRR